MSDGRRKVEVEKQRRIAIDVSEAEYQQLIEDKGSRTWKEILQHGSGQQRERPIQRSGEGDLVIDTDFAEWLAETEEAFYDYFEKRCTIGYGVIVNRYKHEQGWNWITGRSKRINLTNDERNRILLRLEEKAIDKLKEHIKTKALDISESKIKEMRKADYEQFKLFIEYLKNENKVNYQTIYAWVKNRIQKYGDHWSRPGMFKDFLLRYKEDCHTENRACDIPIDEWIKTTVVSTPKSEAIAGI